MTHTFYFTYQEARSSLDSGTVGNFNFLSYYLSTYSNFLK